MQRIVCLFGALSTLLEFLELLLPINVVSAYSKAGMLIPNLTTAMIAKSASVCMDLQAKLGEGLKVYLERYRSSEEKERLYQRGESYIWLDWNGADTGQKRLSQQVLKLLGEDDKAVRVFVNGFRGSQVAAEASDDTTSTITTDITWI